MMPAQAATDPPEFAGPEASGQTTFHGTNPETAAGPAICDSTPTRCQARNRLYRNGVLEREGFPVEDISEYLKDDATIIWLDLRDPDREDLSVLSAEFGLHPVAVEDAIYEHERPKLDRYRSHLFLAAYAVHLDPVSGQLATSELAAFITERALITVRKDDGLDVDSIVSSTSARSSNAGTPAPTWPSSVSATCCTGCSTTSSTGTSRSSRPWTTRSRDWKTSCSPTARSGTARSSGAASSYARAWSCCAASCCPCARW
jgi:hypothetical protein